MNKKTNEIYLVDGNSFCYRAFYAIQELSTSKGFPTNAIYGVINMLRKIIKEYGPGGMTVVFDSKGPTARHDKYKEYKIHRKPMPDDLFMQFPVIKEIIRAHNIPIYELEGYEADDIIATIAEKAIKKGVDVVIVTSDKDALQLVAKNIRVLSPYPKNDKVYTGDEVREKYGVDPDGMVDFMALAGDPSDNIPGVKGVGKVTASRLIKEYGSLENIYKNIDDIKPESLQKKLIDERETAELSRELVELDRAVPIRFDIGKTKLDKPDIKRLSELYKKYEFGKLLREIIPGNESEDKGKEKTAYFTASSEKDITNMLKEIKHSGEVALSILRTPEERDITGIALSWKENESCFVPVAKDKPRGITIDALKDMLEDESIKKIGYDIKEDLLSLRVRGIELKKISFDCLIADYLLDPSRPKYDLADMAMRHLGYNLSREAEGVEWNKSGQGTMDFSRSVEVETVCERCDIIFRLYKFLGAVLEKKKLKTLFDDVEVPLISVLADMEVEGVGIDVPRLKELSTRMKEKLAGVSQKIYDLAGEEFNINSPKQLQVILFDKLKLKPLKRIKTGASTNESVLKKLALRHELPALLLEYRAMNKLKTAYYDSILELTEKKSKKLHAKFNQAVTATGRLSSSQPNLQNIPVKTSMGREIRRVFIPGGRNRCLLAADYSQIELRILAHLSNDAKLKEAFEKGEDIHRFTASLIFGCRLDEVTRRMRAIAKTVNFGITYGMGAFSLAEDLGIEVKEAQSFIDSYFKRYSGVKGFIDETKSSARKEGFVTTILNRRRDIPEINSKNNRVRSFAERVAVNTPVQGSAADLIKLAMIACHKDLEGSGAKMIIQVHDELVFAVPEDRVREIAGKVKDIMENVIKLKVRLKVDIETGPNWHDMEPVKP